MSSNLEESDVVYNIEVRSNFVVANLSNVPELSHNAFVAYFFNQSFNAEDVRVSLFDLLVDFVQIHDDSTLCTIKALVFQRVAPPNIIGNYANVSAKVIHSSQVIIDTECDKCDTTMKSDLCSHVITFLFWLHRVAVGFQSNLPYYFWGNEFGRAQSSFDEPERKTCVFVRNSIESEKHRISDGEEASGGMSQQEFLNFVLSNLEKEDYLFYQHFRYKTSEYQTLFMHHILLNSSENRIVNSDTLTEYLNGFEKKMLDQFSVYSAILYKKDAWYEAQYLRITPKIAYEIHANKDVYEYISEIIESMTVRGVCDGDGVTSEKIRYQKSLIMKQIAKEFNINYHKMGIIISKTHPYICGAIDGLAYDHIIRIKIPKTMKDFDQSIVDVNVLGAKLKAELQMQMFLADTSKALYCIVNPELTQPFKLFKVWVHRDEKLLTALLDAAGFFWRVYVCTHISDLYCLR